jgi:hypothetical protein
MGDQLIGRPLPTHRATQTAAAHTRTVTGAGGHKLHHSADRWHERQLPRNVGAMTLGINPLEPSGYYMYHQP